MKRANSLVLSLVLCGLAFFNACSKSQESDTSSVSSKSAASGDSIPMIAKANRSPNFEPVAKRLDLGGTSYVYMDFGTKLKGIGSKVGQFLQTMNEFEPDPQMMMISMMPIDQIIDSLGISNLAAYGASTYQEGSLYRNKSVIYMPDGVKGLFTLAGTKPEPFEGLQIAPEDTDFYAEFSLNAKAIEAIINTVAQQMYGEQSEQIVEGMLSAKPGPTAPTWGEILQKSNTTVISITKVGPTKSVETEAFGAMDIPTFSAITCLKNMAWLIRDKVIPIDDLKSSQDGDMSIYHLPMPMDDSYIDDYDPAIVMIGDDLYAANKLSYLKTCLSGATTLADSADYQQATADFPKQGNAIMFVSKNAFNSFITIRESLTKAEPKFASVMPIYDMILPIFAIPRQDASSASILVVDQNSIYTEDRWPVPGGNVGSMSSATTVGLLAAMAIPAFNKVREQSREKAITNNLRMIAAAGQQYILEEGAETVSYNQLVGEYFMEIQPVNGEDYTQLVISEEGGTIEVTTANGETVSFMY